MLQGGPFTFYNWCLIIVDSGLFTMCKQLYITSRQMSGQLYKCLTQYNTMPILQVGNEVHNIMKSESAVSLQSESSVF